MSKVVLVASGKGGSGTSTFVVNLGIILANTGARVLICDLNIGLRNDDIYLGLENRVLFDLSDYIGGICSLEKTIIESDICENLFLLPSPQYKTIQGITESRIALMMGELKKQYDFILIDCPVGIGRTLEVASSNSDCGLLVTTPDFVCVRNTDAVSRKMNSFGLKNRFFVINMVTERTMNREPSLDWVSQNMEIPLAGILPYDEEIGDCNNKGTPIVLTGSSYYAKSFIEIAARIVA